MPVTLTRNHSACTRSTAPASDVSRLRRQALRGTRSHLGRGGDRDGVGINEDNAAGEFEGPVSRSTKVEATEIGHGVRLGPEGSLHDSDEPTMTHHDDGLVRATSDVAHCGERAFMQHVVGFKAGRPPTTIEEAGPTLLDLGARLAGPVARVSLHEAGVVLDLESETRREDECGLVRAYERRRPNARDAELGDGLHRDFGLPHAEV